MMWVADSESSTIRSIELDPPAGPHPTRTLAGGDGLIAENLFAFGDRDGRGAGAKLQHPLAVCDGGDGASVFVCDSYNNKIKRVTRDGAASTFAGTGKPGLADGAGATAEFWEPGGIALSADRRTLFVADTNNFAIRKVDIQTRAVTTMALSGAAAAAAAPAAASSDRLVPNRRRAVLLPTELPTAAEFRVALPPRCHFTPGTTSRWQANGAAGKLAGGEMTLDKGAGVARVTLTADAAAAADEVETVVFYCSDADDTCRTEADIWQIRRPAGGGAAPPPVCEHTVGSGK
jgi:hypothetical protein